MIVMKFGGSSVKDAERMKEAAEIVKSRIGKAPIVVLSACKGITDKLIETATKAKQGKDVSSLLNEIKKTHYSIIKDFKLKNSLVEPVLNEFAGLISKIKENKELNDEIMDHVQSFGERLSTRIFAAHLNSIGTPAKQFDAWEIGMLTNSDFGNAEPVEHAPEKINASLKNVKGVAVITGFIGKDINDVITTLGRGGSDYTAAIIGAAVKAEEIQIWTDVNGVMTTDPRIVKEAKTIPEISFNEASELAYFGAKVLHPKTIIPAIEKNVPVKVLNTYEPDNEGTTILKQAKTEGAVKAIACKKNITVMNISSLRMLNAHGFLAKLFVVFAKYNKVVDVISTSEVSVSLTVDDDKDLGRMEKELKKIADVKTEKGKAIICLVGEGMKHTPGIAGRIFSILGNNNVNIEMISQGASEINVSFVVDDKEADKAILKLHEEYFQ